MLKLVMMMFILNMALAKSSLDCVVINDVNAADQDKLDVIPKHLPKDPIMPNFWIGGRQWSRLADLETLHR
jgi:hypothetical protein